MLFTAEPLYKITEESDFLGDYEIYALRIAQNGQQCGEFIAYYEKLGWPAHPDLILGWKYIISTTESRLWRRHREL